jgi:hypothetical protein
VRAGLHSAPGTARALALALGCALAFGGRAFAQAPGGAAGQAGRPGRPGREIAAPPQEVKDSFFAYFIGIISAGIDVDIDAEGMREVLTEFRTSLELPFDLVGRVRQERGTGGAGGTLVLEFVSDAAIPIPFSFLGYHPGSIRVTKELLFDRIVTASADAGAGGGLVPAYRLALARGTLVVDMDRWLDDLLGDYVDDLPVENLVFFRWKGDWTGLLQGTGYKGQPLRAFFNFRRNRIVFPVPAELDGLGRGFTGGRG